MKQDAPWLADTALPAGQQADLVLQIADLYERRGLLTEAAAAPPLWNCCSNAAACWGRLPSTARVEPGGISLPWVGPDYRPGGVAVLGMNFHEASGLTMAFQLAAYELEHLPTGRRKMTYDASGYRGSMFAYRSTRSAAVLLDVADGKPAADHLEPAELGPALSRLARVQAVKCAPANGRRSAPDPEMWANCPEMLLLAELEVVRPAFLIAFGGDAGAALARIPGYQQEPGFGKVRHGTLNLGERSSDVFVLGHPTAREPVWQTSHDDLLAALMSETVPFASA
jgi:hypothetical protein